MPYVIIGSLLINFFLFLFLIYKKNHLEKQVEEKFLKSEKETVKEEINKEREYLQSQLLYEQENNQKLLDIEHDKLEEVKKNISELIASEKEKVDIEIQNYQKLKAQEMKHAYKEKKRQAEEEYQKSFLKSSEKLQEELQKMSTKFEEIKSIKQEELDKIINELDDYQKKQEAAGQEILRRRKIQEQEEFYKISLEKADIEDIQVLRSIEPKLNNKNNLNKMIYDNYCSKLVQAMVKRVLNGTAPSGIYKITRLKTGEIYIGKSTNVKDRWIQHCKTAFHIGTIAHSILHTTMEKDGIENFTFELIEEVPKDKLTEREKYWINFYKSKEYGLNERNA